MNSHITDIIQNNGKKTEELIKLSFSIGTCTILNTCLHDLTDYDIIISYDRRFFDVRAVFDDFSEQ